MISLKDVFNARIIFTLLIGFLVNYFYLSNLSFLCTFIYLPILGLFFEKTRRASYVFIERAVLPVTLGFCIVAIWATVHESHKYDYIFRNALQNYASIQDFFTILSTLYAICIAFLLWKGLSDFDSLRITLHDEASTVQSINDFLHYIDAEGKNGLVLDDIRDGFIQYIEDLLKFRSNDEPGKDGDQQGEDRRFLKSIVGLVSLIDPRDENDRIALAEIMKELSNLSHLKSRRSSYMDGGMSPYLMALLFMISASLLLPFLMREPNSSYIIHVLIFSLTTFFSFLYLTLIDINNPFDGYWYVKIKVFNRVIEHIKKDKNDFNNAEDRAAKLKEAN